MNNAANLVTMANQIARNLAVHGERQAITETAAHIRSFWDPWMIRGLKAAHASGDVQSALEPIARAALALLDSSEAA